MNLFYVILLGVAPSLIWLFYYLRKDVHAELKRWILIVFLLGMAVTPAVAGIQWFLSDFFAGLNLPQVWLDVIIIFFATALIEELFKYFAAEIAIRKNPEFDEPVDAMIYMIVSALGFAAVENILIVSSYVPFYPKIEEAITVLFLRFTGATFLHTLASATLGYYLALSFYYTRKKKWLIFEGILLATLLHGLFNYFIMLYQGQNLYVFIYLAALAVIVGQYFKMLKRTASICEMPKEAGK